MKKILLIVIILGICNITQAGTWDIGAVQAEGGATDIGAVQAAAAAPGGEVGQFIFISAIPLLAVCLLWLNRRE